jgi:hypothetical protein
MAVVRLRQRNAAERDGRRPGMDLRTGALGSDQWPRVPAFCAIPAGAERREKNVPTDGIGGASGIRTLAAGVHLWPISRVANNSKQRVLQAPDLNLRLRGVQSQYPAYRADANPKLTGNRQLPFACRPRSLDSALDRRRYLRPPEPLAFARAFSWFRRASTARPASRITTLAAAGPTYTGCRK